MHVLLIHQAFAGPGEPGGTRHFEFARHHVRQGGRFTVVTSDRSYLTGERVETDGAALRAETHDGVRVLRAPTAAALHRSFVSRVGAFVSFMGSAARVALGVRDVDVVMGTTPPLFQAVSAWIVARRRRVPFVLEVRDLWPEFAVAMGVLTNPVLIALARRLEHFLYARADHFIVNSPAYRDYLVEKGVPAARVTLIANGVDPSMFAPDDDGAALRQSLGLEGRFVVTYAGALGLANDIPTILAAAERLRDRPDVHVLLVGDGKERPALEASAQARGLTNVTFAGARPKRDMAQVLAASDACIATLQNIPMFTTTYPNKVFDYMAAARPTLLAIDGVIREVVEAADGGLFVPPGDPDALAAAVRTLADDPARARAMGQAARAYVSRHFDRATQADAFVALLRSLASTRRP